MRDDSQVIVKYVTSAWRTMCLINPLYQKNREISKKKASLASSLTLFLVTLEKRRWINKIDTSKYAFFFLSYSQTLYIGSFRCLILLLSHIDSKIPGRGSVTAIEGWNKAEEQTTITTTTATAAAAAFCVFIHREWGHDWAGEDWRRMERAEKEDFLLLWIHMTTLWIDRCFRRLFEWERRKN